MNSAGVSPLCNCIVTIPIPISKKTFLQQKTFSIQIADSCNSLFWVLIGEQKKNNPFNQTLLPSWEILISVLGNTYFLFGKSLFPFWEIPISLWEVPYFHFGKYPLPLWEIPVSSVYLE